jgi:hypothetical protein
MTDDRSGAGSAERRLREADPVCVRDLPDAREPAQSAVLRAILDTPRERTAGSRRRRRRARAAVGGLGLAALGVLVALLLVATRGPEGSTPASVAAPPRVYSVLSRPQTPEEAAASIAPFASNGVVRASVRIADPGPAGRYLLFRDGSGALCVFAEGPRGGGGGGCGVDLRRPPSVGVVGGQVVGDVHRLYALVPDGIVAASVDGRQVAVTDNVFHVDLPRATRSATVDFLTRDGVVTAWRQTVPLVVPPRPRGPEPAFGAQARLLQPRPPRMSVACPRAGSIACDRIGLVVWLRTPARRVVAKIDGRRLVLDAPRLSGPATNGLRRRFGGYLRPAGLIDGPLPIPGLHGGTRWTGDPPVRKHVIINVYAPDGSVPSAGMRVRLAPAAG